MRIEPLTLQKGRTNHIASGMVDGASYGLHVLGSSSGAVTEQKILALVVCDLTEPEGRGRPSRRPSK